MLRLSRFLVLLVTFLATSLPCSAAEPQVFDLTWQASGSGCSINVQPDVQEPFAKEPDFAKRQVVRGLLPCAKRMEQRIAYIWDFEQKRLYIDKNRNRDLTDDRPPLSGSRRQRAHDRVLGPAQFAFASAARSRPHAAHAGRDHPPQEVRQADQGRQGPLH